MTAQDMILHVGRSQILHGSLSDRAYLTQLAPGDVPEVVDALERLAKEHGYGKLFGKVPHSLVAPFHAAGYVTEALVPGMFAPLGGGGREDGHFISRFPDKSRSREQDPERALLALRLAGVKAHDPAPAAPPDWRIERLTEADCDAMARLYDNAFATYPFPINDPEYLRRNMTNHVVYYGVRLHGELIALSGCETDPEQGFVEMTDFGSRTEARGHGAAYHLLDAMERDMASRGFHTGFTISRGRSIPINVSFARRGYTYAGTLVGSTNISGSLESMNVWFKAFK